ncbi:MAG TPA: hypothetical protein PLF13_03395 [candidate division Zixibacteria bacterium]|nr:hypothetical protein [candidate division Zixibacteria bacterium]
MQQNNPNIRVAQVVTLAIVIAIHLTLFSGQPMLTGNNYNGNSNEPAIADWNCMEITPGSDNCPLSDYCEATAQQPDTEVGERDVQPSQQAAINTAVRFCNHVRPMRTAFQ